MHFREEIADTTGASEHWNTTSVISELGKFGDTLARISEAFFETDPSRVSSVRDEVRRLQRNTFYEVLELAFQKVFPTVDVVRAVWTQPDRVKLPTSVFSPIVDTWKIPKDTVVFLPVQLLSRFVWNAMQNLATAAFRADSSGLPTQSWTHESIRSEAKAWIDAWIECASNGKQIAVLRICDNGPKRVRGPQKPGKGHGLAHLKLMAEQFDAELILPQVQENITIVELRMRIRSTGGSQDGS
jgi:hypothetical protein